MFFGRADPEINPVSEIGKTLGADYILTGSVSASAGDPVSGTISLFLIDVHHKKNGQ
jgi:TolB-like protein